METSAIQNGAVSESVYMIPPSKVPPQPSEAKPLCLRMNFPMWKAVLLTYCGSSTTSCSSEICEFAERCVDHFDDIIKTEESASKEGDTPWDIALNIENAERNEQLHMYWLDAMDTGRFASMEFVRQQSLLGMTWILRTQKRLDVAINKIESAIKQKERELKDTQDATLESLSTSIDRTQRELDTNTNSKLPDTLSNIDSAIRRRIGTKTLMQESLSRSVRCNMQKEVFSVLEATRSRNVCGLCSRWCEVSDDVSLEELRAQIAESTMSDGVTSVPSVKYTYPLPQKQAVESPAVPCSFDLEEPWSLKGLKTSSRLSPARYCHYDDDVLKSEYVYFCPPEYSRVARVELTGHEIEGRLMSRHAVYKIQVTSEDGNTWEIRHRYSDFDELKEDLCDTYGARLCAADVFPEKKYFGNLDTSVLRERQRGLEAWMNQILRETKFDDNIREFLLAGKGSSGSTEGSCNCMTPFTVDILNAKRRESQCVPVCGLRQHGFLFQEGSGKCIHK